MITRPRLRQSRLAQLDLDNDGAMPLNIPDSTQADVMLTDEVSGIAATPLFIPSKTGIYEVYYYLMCTSAGVGDIELQFNFDDGVTAKTVAVVPTLPLNVLGNFISGDVILLSVADLAVFYEMVAIGLGGGAEYAAFLHVNAV